MEIPELRGEISYENAMLCHRHVGFAIAVRTEVPRNYVVMEVKSNLAARPVGDIFGSTFGSVLGMDDA